MWFDNEHGEQNGADLIAGGYFVFFFVTGDRGAVSTVSVSFSLRNVAVEKYN